ncbi:tyrosine-type recombinase/integrase [Halobacterium salinarum]|uniref:Phage integrase family protein n=1 Tax=Halobacterium salinarum (strain ATCC 33171 / DSM 3754 / JCM 8978 / NBRC 102687 / NCIMB 764 / 91-R6) TaxID=2597657 RepID=A0A4D6GS86_HALS9|nr:tyrosine-type recombinase/integrase [Halobacterium salinarum]QCC44610.1 XerC/D-like integrase [Halobacterium salinarum]TYO74933.1 Phage integrase family protein [Halobacterium salinarum DSM 3754]
MSNNNATPGVRDLETLLDDRMVSLESPQTQQITRVAVNNLFQFLAENNDVDAVEDVDEQDARDWVIHLVKEDELAPNSIRTYFALARATFGWWQRSGEIDQNPLATTTAEEVLPSKSNDVEQQFWNADAREQLLTYVDERAHAALENDSNDAARAFRDRSLVYILADTGVRGAEVCSVSRDDRRNGLRWEDVDLEAGVMTVLGKSGDQESVSLPGVTTEKLARYRRLIDAPDEWPVIPTGDAASKYRAVRDELADRGYEDAEIEEVLEDCDIGEVLREYEVAPPALTTEGARTLLQRLCEQGDVDIDGDYLKPHGGRRGLGDELYGEVAAESAQEVLRHKSIETTHASYRDRHPEDLAADIEKVRYKSE